MFLEADGDDWIASRLYWSGMARFEPETLPLFLDLAGGSGVIFDVGANTGLYGLAAAAQSSKSKVYAFEPVPKTFQKLERNIRVNELRNLHPVCAAACDVDGEIPIYLPPGPYLPISASAMRGFRETGESIQARALRLDTFRRDEGIGAVDLMKVDTEGTEPGVLSGAQETLREGEPILICEVLRGLTEDALHGILDPLDYRYFHITEQGLVPRERIVGDASYRWMNYLFVPASKVDRVRRYLGEP
jgi:FkbM family methyltransferase